MLFFIARRLVIGFTDAAAGTGTYVEWKARLESYRSRIEALTHETLSRIDMLKYSTAEDIPCEDSVEIDQGDGGMYECEILLRSDTEGSDVNWHRYRLKQSNLSTLEFTPIGSVKLPSISDKLSPCSSVYESSLGDNTLQIVTAKTTLHISVESTSERMFLIAVLREAIRVSAVDTIDTLFAHAILKVDDDEVYTIEVKELGPPMGLGFKRIGEWMAVNKSKNFGVTAGSVLCAINGGDVLLHSYRDTMSQMRQTHPPLTLSFRCCLRKQDDLLLMSKTLDITPKVVWEPRTFVLLSNSLAYYPLGTVDTDVLKNDVKSIHMDLFGAQVKLLDPPYLIAEDKCCFILSSGLATITVQCSSYKQVRQCIYWTHISLLFTIILNYTDIH